MQCGKCTHVLSSELWLKFQLNKMHEIEKNSPFDYDLKKYISSSSKIFTKCSSFGWSEKMNTGGPQLSGPRLL